MEIFDDETIKEADIIFINGELVSGAKKLHHQVRSNERGVYRIARLKVPDEQVAALVRRIEKLKA